MKYVYISVLFIFLLSINFVNAYTIELKRGWNIVSSPVDQQIPLEKITEKCKIGKYKGMAIIYVTSAGKLEERSAIPTNEGVYIYLDEEECKIEVGGSEKPLQSIQLSSGWNLISPGRIKVSELKKYCSIEKVVTWDPEKSNWVELSDSDELNPAKGYWVKVSTPCVISGKESVQTGETHIIKGSIYAPGWNISEIKNNCYLVPVYSSLSPETKIHFEEVSAVGGATFSFTTKVKLKPQAKCVKVPYFVLLLRCEKNGKIYGGSEGVIIPTGTFDNGKFVPITKHTVGKIWLLTEEDSNTIGGTGYIVIYIQDRNGKPLLYNEDIKVCSDACQTEDNGNCETCVSSEHVQWGSGNAFVNIWFTKSLNKVWAEVTYNGKIYKSKKVWFHEGVGGDLVVVIDDSEDGKSDVCA